MPAYEPGGHQASDSLYIQAALASQVTQVSAGAAKSVASSTGNGAARAYQGVKAAVRNAKYGTPGGPRITLRGRVSRRVFLLKKGLKESPRSILK